jgi:hypothetical protein
MTDATPTFQDIPENPFKDDVVKQPRDVSFSVEGLNDEQLEELVTAFSTLDDELAPHEPVAAAKVQIVVSPEGGYGKSHLLGRLFGSLGPRATKVYIQPFQDPDRPWYSILRRTLQELERPDGEEEDDGGPAQLEMLAVAVLAHVAADFIAGGALPGDPKARDAAAVLRKLGREPAIRNAPGQRWLEWAAERLAISRDAAGMASQLRLRNIDMDGREAAWLKILAALALEEPFSEKRNAAAKWLRAEPLEPEELGLLGLDAASNDARGDAVPKEVNDLCFRRLEGLCLLASYHRPFLFCFDQSEFYARDEALIKTLGSCIYQLYEQLRNHLSIITTNEEIWLQQIQPNIERSQRQRLSKEIRLDGIDKEGAHELVAERLSEYCLARYEIDRFFDGWLDEVFSILPQLPARTLLEQAAARFKLLADGGTELRPKPALDELFQQEVDSVRSAKAPLYDEDAFIWFVKDVGQGLPGVSISRLRRQRYFSLEWSWPDRSVAFAFEGGSHWRKWSSLVDEAVSLAQERSGGAFLSYVLRTPDLRKVPAHAWPKVEAAARQGFQLHELTEDQACELHGAFNLYSSALQENIPYSGDDTLAWLQGRFAPLLSSLAHRPAPAAAGAGESP